MAYHPGKNSLYIPYVDNCLDMSSANPSGPAGPPPYEVSPTTCQGPPLPAVAETAPAPAAGGGRGGRGDGGPAAGGGGGRGGQGGAAGGGRGGGAGGGTAERRVAIRREGSDPQKFAGVARVNVATGELTRLFEGCAPGNGATLVTNGDLVFWGDLARNFRAIDADSGKVLWQTVLPGSIQNSTITYAVNGKQYVAVLTGRGAVTSGLITQANIQPPPPNTNGVFVFALP